MIISDRHRLALRAALLEGAESAEAFADWSRRVPLNAVDHDEFRLLPLIYRRAEERGCSTPVMGRLKGVYRQVWVKNTLLLQTCARTIGLLREAGIPTLLLKGIAIFARWADNVGPRAMRDIDILVPRAAARRAIHILTQSGWTVKHFSLSDFAELDFEWRHALTLCSDNDCELDLHWRVLPRNTSPKLVDMFWSGSQLIKVMGETTRVLQTEDQLYHSLIHGARWTDGACLDWMVDAFILLRSQAGDIDWARVTEHTYRDRSVPAVSRQFKLLREVLGEPTTWSQAPKWYRCSLLDVIAFKNLQKPYDYLQPGARILVEYHDFLIRNGKSITPSTWLAFIKERFVIQRTVYRMPKGLIRLLEKPLKVFFEKTSVIREEGLPAIDSQVSWNAGCSPFLYGWSYPERNGRWTNEAQAILGFRDSLARSTDLLATVEAQPYLTSRHRCLMVDAIVNGVLCGSWRLSGQEIVPVTLTFTVPRAARHGSSRTLLVTFIMKSPARPLEVGNSQDVRTLGFFLERICFTNRGSGFPP